MIRICLADDDAKERHLMQEHFQKLQTETLEELELVTYSSGELLLSGYDGTYDIVCLDIDMPGIDGINTAREIRKTDENVTIIFITNMAQLAIKGYEVRALDFILKPVEYYSFAMKMKSAISIINNKKSRNIVIAASSGMQKIYSDDIYYVEVSGHYLCYHTSGGTFTQKAPLRDLDERLDGLSFKRCNNCYLVNLKYVDCVNKDECKVAGEWLKISRPRKKDFLKALTNYMGGLEI